MSPPRTLLVAAIVLSGSIECQAKPLSFNGVQLGQKWGPFLKAHPKAEVFSLGLGDDTPPLTRAQELAREAKNKESALIEVDKARPFLLTFYHFYNGSLTFCRLLTKFEDFNRGLISLKKPLQELLTQLGAPTDIGVTPAEAKIGNGHYLILVWKRPTQSAFAVVPWSLSPTRSLPFSLEVQIINAPWREAQPKFPVFWPALLAPDKEDRARKRELTTLMEKLQPGSTRHMKPLGAAPSIAVFPWSIKVKSP